MTVREVRDSLGRYLAILGIIALGCGFFTGLKVTKTAMLETGYRYMLRNGFYDWRLVSTLGWDSQAVAEMQESEGIESAEGMITLDAVAVVNDREVVLKFHSITDCINTSELVSGRWPESSNECVIDEYDLAGISLGDRIGISDENTQDTLNSFSFDSYTVVGYVRNPMYINFERGTTTLGSGSVSGFVCLPPEGFCCEYYTDIYLSCTEHPYVYSQEYNDLIEKRESVVTEAAQKAAENRFVRVKDSAEQKLIEAEAEYEEGLAQYGDGLAQYSEYVNRYQKGLKEYNEGEKLYREKREETERQLASAYEQLKEAEKKIKKSETALSILVPDFSDSNMLILDAASRIISSSPYIDDETAVKLVSVVESVKELAAEKRPERIARRYREILNSISGIREEIGASDRPEFAKSVINGVLDSIGNALDKSVGRIVHAYEELQNGKNELEKGWKEYEEGKNKAENEFAKTERLLKESKNQLAEARKELSKAEKELAEAKTKLDDGAAMLSDAKDAIDKLTAPDVYVLDRDTNVGYVCFQSDTNIVDGIAKVFPVFFFAVAALVCVTTMNRMVDDERGQLGILKALGYSNRTIMSRYFIYTGSASLLGCAVGAAIGSWLFPTVIWKAYMIMYSMPEITLVYDWKLMVLSTVSYLAIALTVTWLTCRDELRQPAAELIRPKSPPAGKRVWLEHIGFVWKRLSFLAKVSLRNVFRYRKRLIMMILGIGGCTGLVLTGFGLNDSITHIADRQFSEISVYDADISFTIDMTGDERAEFLEKTGSVIEQKAFTYSTNCSCSTEAYTGTVTLIAPENFSDLHGLMNFHDGKIPVAAPGDNECIISRNLSDKYRVEVGDEIELGIGDTEKVYLKVSGIFDNVIYNYVYAPLSSVKRQLSFEPEIKNAYLNLDGDIYSAAAVIASAKGVANVSLTEDMRLRVDSMLSSMKYVVVLVISCAAALSFIVLFNLTNINIMERIREIATIKVLGFNSSETSQYVFRENMILTLCGCVAGIPMGIWLHDFVMSQIKIDMISFQVVRTWPSYVVSILLTFLFTVAVNAVMMPRLEKINMAEALKSVE